MLEDQRHQGAQDVVEVLDFLDRDCGVVLFGYRLDLAGDAAMKIFEKYGFTSTSDAYNAQKNK